jgi:predicted aconitase with swiveling domain
LAEDRGVCSVRELGDLVVPTDDLPFLGEVADLKKLFIDEDRILSGEEVVGVGRRYRPRFR